MKKTNLFSNTFSPLKMTKANGVYKNSNGAVEKMQIQTENNSIILDQNQISSLSMFKRQGENKNFEVKQDKFEEFKQSLYLIPTETLYESIITSARVLPKIKIFEEKISNSFEQVLFKNLSNLKNFSPSFYVKNIEQKENFIVYQVFIYLIHMIVYVDCNKKNEEFQLSHPQILNVIEWCSLRYFNDMEYILIGPKTSTNYQLDYKSLYKTLISPINEVENQNIIQYFKLTNSKEQLKILNSIKEIFSTRDNSFEKIFNESKSYQIQFSEKNGITYEVDDKNNLIFNCQEVEIGDVTSETLNLKYNSLLGEEKLLHVNSKNSANKLNELMSNYDTIKIIQLKIGKNIFSTPLNSFDELYLVFPNINLVTRSNQIHSNGSLQINGHFVLNDQEMYEFVPDKKNGINFKRTTANVKKIDFYITDKPNQNSMINFYDPNIIVDVRQIFNVPIKIGNENNENYIFILYDNDFNQLKESIFLYNANSKILQLLPINWCDLETINELTNYTFDTNYQNFQFYDEDDFELDYKSNMYKAYETSFDLLKNEWNKLDFILSLRKISEKNDVYENLYTDLNLKPIIDEENYSFKFTKYIKKVINTPTFLMINVDTKKFYSRNVIIDNKKYYAQKINKNSIQVNFYDVINKNLKIISDININMILELC